MGKTSIYLSKADETAVRELSREYGSISEVIRAGLATLKKQRIEALLVEKYRAEAPLPDRVAGIQSEAASDLGEYPW